MAQSYDSDDTYRSVIGSIGATRKASTRIVDFSPGQLIDLRVVVVYTM